VGVTYSLECLNCGVTAPEVGDFGHIGAPTLGTTAKRNALRPFGQIYAALEAVGLLTEELESTKAFLGAHKGHRVKLLGDGEAEGDDEDEGDFEGDAGGEGGRQFRWRKGKFVEAFHVIECAKCGESLRSPDSLRLRPFSRKTLTAEDAKSFLAGAGGVDDHVYRVGPPFGSLDNLLLFVAKHRAHGPAVALDEGQRAKAVGLAARGKAPADPAPAWTDAADEKRLSPPRGERLWEALRGLRHKDVRVRRSSIARLCEARDPGLFGHVASTLQDPDAQVRATAAAALADIPDARRLAPLGRALLDHDGRVRESARKALVGVGLDLQAAMEAAVAPTPAPPARADVTGVTEVDLFSGNVKTRAAAADALALNGDDDSLTWLSKALADPTSEVRASAVAAMGALLKKSPAATPWLMAAFEDYSDSVIRAALKTAGTNTADSLVERIDALVREGRVYETECIEALEAIGTLSAQRALARLMDHETPHVAERAASSLIMMKPVHVLAELTAAISHKNRNVAALASSALAKLPLNLVLERLIEAFREKPHLRHEILSSLESRNGKELHRLFLAGLRDPSKPVRLRAAMWLAKQSDERSRTALVAAARRGDGTVSAGAFEVLLARIIREEMN